MHWNLCIQCSCFEQGSFGLRHYIPHGCGTLDSVQNSDCTFWKTCSCYIYLQLFPMLLLLSCPYRAPPPLVEILYTLLLLGRMFVQTMNKCSSGYSNKDLIIITTCTRSMSCIANTVCCYHSASGPPMVQPNLLGGPI